MSAYAELTSTGQTKCSSCVLPLQEPYIHCISCDMPRVDVCLQCFSRGAEFGKHLSHHRYEVVKNDFPVFEPSWTAAEEMRLLEAIADCGVGNWEAVANQIQTKTKQQCYKHYRKFYIDSPKPPLPLLREQNITIHPSPVTFKLCEDPPRPAEGSTLQLEMAGYMAGRGDFMVEHDNYAETDLNELCIQSDEDALDREIKLAALEAYRDVLKERQRRKRILRNYGLIHIKKQNVYNRRYNYSFGASVMDSLRVFTRLLSPMDWDKFLESLHFQNELQYDIKKLQEYREAGITRLHSAQIYDHLKQRREEEKTQRHLLSDVLGHLQNEIVAAQQSRNHQVVLEKISKGMPVPSYATSRKNAPPLKIMGLPAYEKLSEKERALCSVVRLVPESYLEFKRILLAECAKHGYLRLAQARTLLKIDVNKTRKLYDFLLDEGLVNKNEIMGETVKLN